MTTPVLDTRTYRTELEQPSACGGRWGLYVDGRLIARTDRGTGPRRRPSLGVQPTRTACTSSTTMEHGRAISRSDQLVLREVLDLEPLRQRIAAPP